MRGVRDIGREDDKLPPSYSTLSPFVDVSRDQGTQCEDLPPSSTATSLSPIFERLRAERSLKESHRRSKSVRREGQRTHRRERSLAGMVDSRDGRTQAGRGVVLGGGDIGGGTVSVVGEKVPGMSSSEEQVAAFWTEFLPRIGAEWQTKQLKLQTSKREPSNSPVRHSPSPVPLHLRPLDNPPLPSYNKRRRIYYKPRPVKDFVEIKRDPYLRKRTILQLDGKRQALIRAFPAPLRLQRSRSP